VEHLRIEERQCRGRRAVNGATVGQVEDAAVPRALDAGAIELALVQRPGERRADGGGGADIRTVLEERERRALQIDPSRLAGDELSLLYAADLPFLDRVDRAVVVDAHAG